MDRFSFLNVIHPEQLENLYTQYLQSPDSIEPSWKAFFQGFDFASSEYSNDFNKPATNQIFPIQQQNGTVDEVYLEKIRKEFRVKNLINAYRERGHLFTKTNPVRARREYSPKLTLESFKLSDSDLDEKFNSGTIIGFEESTTLRNIIARLDKMYCQHSGIEYMYIRFPERVNWIQDWLNKNENQPVLDKQDQVRILEKINKATFFENYLHTKFVGQKRFSLEGGEALIPGMEELIAHAAGLGVEEFVVGMPHRGRLNMLVNIFGKKYDEIFSDFEGKDFEEEDYDGDVKYHVGTSTAIETYRKNNVKLNLVPNPSHLEAVDPVAIGIARAMIDLDYNNDYNKVLPIIIHGDAAIAAQGIVYETIQMMNLEGYKTGGTIHIVVNNQIGFTTNYLDARSSVYCTDIGKVTFSPIIHVNSDDVESVIHAMRFAVEYRQKFNTDVFIDLLGYRRYGHNEGDEPRFTQPILYKTIEKHPNPAKIYHQELVEKNIAKEEDLSILSKEYSLLLDQALEDSKKIEKTKLKAFLGSKWENYIFPNLTQLFEPVDTTFSKEKLVELTNKLTEDKENIKLIKKTTRMLKGRYEMVNETNKIDWGMAETLAYATLLDDNFNIRISGEDVERGTFSHRHAVMKLEDSEEKIIPLQKLSPTQGKFKIYNSLLSEYGVLGFDYGYAIVAPNTLTIWEAQFGDFSNGAQTIIDQYLSGGEDKWKIRNGLVMLLPHGYEGQGAEHSSARIERYLQISAQLNMFVANCTTPANFYHLLRKQMKTNYRKPLIVFTPKSLLRHPKCVSTVEELTNGQFKTIIDDEITNKNQIEKVVLCSGKFYYDLLQRREEIQDTKVALVRLEQLYPLPLKEIEEIINSYPNKKSLVWAQEEPKNMGAWSHILRRLREFNFDLISPPSSAATAPGSSGRFKKVQEKIISEVFS